MATISNVPRPGYVWDATDNCWYPIGVGAHSHNEIPNTIVDAKGDLIVGTAADTVARKAVGADGSVLVADSTQTTGVNWAGTMQYAGKNKIINGDFGIWQRGTSGFATGGAYNSDRWSFYGDGTGATRAITQQSFTAGAAPVAGYESQYYWRLNQSVAGTGGTENSLLQGIEDVRTLAGQTATVSFWAKADATRTITVMPIQRFGSGGSAQVVLTSQTASVTTSWTRYSFTFSIPSISGKTIGAGSALYIYIQFPVNTTQTWDIWGVQVEAGSVATPFVPAGGGSQQAELALCQRYFYRANSLLDSNVTFALGWNDTTTQAYYPVVMPVTLRAQPSISFSAANTFLAGIPGGSQLGTATATNTLGAQLPVVRLTVASGLTAGYATRLLANATANAYIDFSAEL